MLFAVIFVFTIGFDGRGAVRHANRHSASTRTTWLTSITCWLLAPSRFVRWLLYWSPKWTG
jgi:hypothetical protein